MSVSRSSPAAAGTSSRNRPRTGRPLAALAALCLSAALPVAAGAQDRPFWDQSDSYGEQRRGAAPGRPAPRRDDAYRPESYQGPAGGFGQNPAPYGQAADSPRPPAGGQPYDRQPYGTPEYAAPRQAEPYRGPGPGPRVDDAYSPPPEQQRQGGWGDGYRDGTRQQDAYRPNSQPGYPGGGYDQPPPNQGGGYGQPYTPPPDYDGPPPAPRGQGQGGYAQDGRVPYGEHGRPDDRRRGGTYSQNEVVDTGHRFFGSISQGLASGIEHVFKNQGRPNGYILGEDAGGAFVAGLRYGEGVLYTKDVGNHRVYWQGPSLGYDFGGEGSKAMVLVYNLRDPADIYARFGGVQGAAYLIGGVSIQFQQHENVTLAVIRSGVGLRLGANVGYLKYTRTPTWNPF